MIIQEMAADDKEWKQVTTFAQNCSWGAGKTLANMMNQNEFTDWERVIIAIDNNQYAGFCTVTKKDCIPELTYTPNIGFMFVDERYRGARLSQRLIQFAMDYLKSNGFTECFLTSDHENLYEKYGFEVIDRKMAPWGEVEKIYRQEL